MRIVWGADDGRRFNLLSAEGLTDLVRWGEDNSVRLPALPLQARASDAELDEPLVFDFDDIDGAAVRAAKTEIAGPGAEHVDFLVLSSQSE